MNNKNKQNLEIERKFLLNPWKIPSDTKHAKQACQSHQGYLSINPGYEVRISLGLFLTRKIGSGLIRQETVEEVSKQTLEILWPLTEGKRVKKTRYYLKLPGGYIGEWDVYKDENNGLNTIEVEFPNAEEALAFNPPVWFGQEVTNDPKYKNSNLAK